MPEKLDNERLRFFLDSWPDRVLKYLYDFHRPKLLRISEWRTHDCLASEDIVQESISEIWERREWILSQPTLRIENYLTTITINKSISYYKRVNMMNENAPHILNGYLGGNDTDEAQRSLAEKDETIWRIISEFPTKERECLSLKYQSELSTEEIALQLGVTKKAVERSITSAYKRLRQYKDVIG